MSQPRTIWDALLPFGIFAVLGTILLIVGGIVAASNINTRNMLVQVEGSVVDFQTASGSDGDVMYAPVVEFTAQDGRRYEFVGNVRSRPAEYALEQKVTVLYDPANPQGAILESFMELWFAPALFGFIGSIFAFIGYVGVYFAVRPRTDR
jgi:hypothetical protein